MSKLAKKVIDIEKYPADKSHMIEKSKESSSEKKGLRINKRKNQHNDKKQAINKWINFQHQNMSMYLNVP